MLHPGTSLIFTRPFFWAWCYFEKFRCVISLDFHTHLTEYMYSLCSILQMGKPSHGEVKYVAKVAGIR